MANSYKPGGGNKPQPYVPAGCGEKSGEYTDALPSSEKKTDNQPTGRKNCFIKNIPFRFNFMNSKLVRSVVVTIVAGQGASIPRNGRPNSVVKKIIGGYVATERYYDNMGRAYLDIDYTCHKNIATHPYVPHVHRWKLDDNGELHRQSWEKFQ
ncbi:MAG TPA: hypothetical protein DCZ41_04485 [Firmicutes bacterium]|nr:hypothetical protein [Bacillota bacterium]